MVKPRQTQEPECTSKELQKSGRNKTNPMKSYLTDCSWYYFGEGKLDLNEKWFLASHSEQPMPAKETF